MIRVRRFLPVALLATMATLGLLLSYRPEPVAATNRANLANDYFFRGAGMTLAGEDGRVALAIDADAASRERESSALRLEKAVIRQGGASAWSLAADSAQLPHENAEITAQGNLRLTLGASGQWVARARRARVGQDGTRVTLTGDVEILRPDGGSGGWMLSGEHIILEPETMFARTSQPVRLRVGKLQFEARGLSAKIGEQVIKLESDVRSIADP